MATSGKYIFISPTLKFCIAGFFIPGFTAVGIWCLQQGLVLLGIECDTAWVILWWITWIGTFLAPVIFIRQTKKRILAGHYPSFDRIAFFNLIEYVLLQCSLATFFTNDSTLCYVTDGQNGLEFVFTAWIALPILIILSVAFDIIMEENVYDSNDENIE